jgi:hypothetical protein
MQRINSILQKLQQIASQPNQHVLDIDLMLDHTRNLYSELLDKKAGYTKPAEVVAIPQPVLPDHTPQQNKAELGEREQEALQAEKDEEAVEIATEVAETQEPELQPEPEPAPVDNPAVEEKRPYAPGPDIRSFISINDKYQYISELFNNDKADYESTLKELNSFASEEQALEWLNFTVVDTQNWNLDSDAVQMFYKLLNDFFARR